MLVVAIILTILLAITLLRFGLSVEYSAEGLTAKVKAGPLSFKVLPQKDKSEKDLKRAELKKIRREEKKKAKKSKEKRPGGLGDFKKMLHAGKTTLDRLRRRLLIKRLVLHYTAAGDDPAGTAMGFGAANAAFGAIIPVLENNFRIRRYDLKASADFETNEAAIYANILISIAVWEALYVFFALLPIFARDAKRPERLDKKDRKEAQKNEQSPDE